MSVERPTGEPIGRAKVQRDGRITIPKEVRRQAGLLPGDKLRVDVFEAGGIRWATLRVQP